MERHPAPLPLVAWILATLATVGCTAAAHRAPSASRATADAPLTYVVPGPFEDGTPVLIPHDANPFCVPHYVVLYRHGVGPNLRYMIEFVFAYASEEWDRDRLAVTIAAYDEHGHVLVTETQQTEDLRSRTPTEPVVFVPGAIVGSSSNQVQVTVKGGVMEDVARIVIQVAAH